MTAFEFTFLCFFASFLFVLFRLTRAVERLKETHTELEQVAHQVAVEEGYIEKDELPIGVYHPNEEDANRYWFDKMQEIRNQNGRVPLDWSRDDEGQT